MKKLNKNETTAIYKRINKIAYHNANETTNMSSLSSDEKKKAFYQIRGNLRKAFLKYDSNTKLATAIQDLSKLDKYENAKTTYKAIFNDAPSSKKTAKKKAYPIARI